nr:IS200/IS605 family transposase [uncultured Draconibacterium sp.]
MAKYRKLSHTVYHCNFHVVFVPKYRYRILESKVKDIVDHKIRQVCEWNDVEIEEMNIQADHVHLLISIPPERSVSEIMGIIKGKSAIHLFKTRKRLNEKPYWGNHFWARGYFVTTVGVDEELIRRYIQHQEKEEKKRENESQDYRLF